ncbi:Cytoplasmic dynein 2 light intermediate chain 1 [Nowakowskiella sp. JEL0407]|nr:Cytoplasmic dynein 2 light intermediate chain 1 [Nowakowskiella sp. JEL0407]
MSGESQTYEEGLARLIALFPHVDVSILSTSLERSNDTEEAIKLVQKMTRAMEDGKPSDVKKSRPAGSARMREQKVIVDNTEDSSEDERPRYDKTQRRDRSNRPASAMKNGMISAVSDGAINQIPANQLSNKDPITTKSHTSIHDLDLDKSMSRSGAVHDLNLDEEDSDIDKPIAYYTTTEKITNYSVSSPVLKSSQINTGQHSPHPPQSKPMKSQTQFKPVSDNEESTYESNTDSEKEIENNRKFKSVADSGYSPQLQELLTFVSSFQPEIIELSPELKPFISEYIPAIGDIDPMIKIPHPAKLDCEGKQPFPQLGLTVVDEPSAKQSIQAVLDLHLRSIHKTTHTMTNQHVRSISLSFSTAASSSTGQKSLAQWVQNVNDLHLHKPPDRVDFSRRMPDLESLMSEWPPEFNDALTNETIRLPSVDINISLAEYSRLICNILDIPIYSPSSQEKSKAKSNKPAKNRCLIESLYLMMMTYVEFKNSQHFGHQIHRLPDQFMVEENQEQEQEKLTVADFLKLCNENLDAPNIDLNANNNAPSSRKDIWSLIKDVKQREKKSENLDAGLDNILVFVGYETPFPSVALEYNYGRRTRGVNAVKDVVHIWELAGGTFLSDLIRIPVTEQNLHNSTFVIVANLAEPEEMIHVVDHFIAAITKRVNDLLDALEKRGSKRPRNLRNFAIKKYGDNSDREFVNPCAVPLLILGTKYDKFKDFEPEKKKLICKTLRHLAHYHGASLLFVSNKDENLSIKVGLELGRTMRLSKSFL